MPVHNDEVICGEFGDGAFNGRRGQQTQEVVLGIRQTQHMHGRTNQVVIGTLFDTHGEP